jgi:hypothetical protein
MTTVAQRFAELVQARANSYDAVWFERHTDRIAALNGVMPSGAGFDNGTEIVLADDLAKAAGCSTGAKLVFQTAFHHMTADGVYDGWTEHTVTVTPSFIGGFDLKVSGRDRNQIKDYIADTFSHALGAEAPILV